VHPSSIARSLGPLLAAAIGVSACGGKDADAGPGSPSCSRPAVSTGCTATWKGAVSGSTDCAQLAWVSAGSWHLEVSSVEFDQLQARLSLPSVPAAGDSFHLGDVNGGLVQLNVGNAWWGATRTLGGDLLFHVDAIVPGSFYAEGSLAGSLVSGSGNDDVGVQLCITF
jgi:hypothetical protein